jgi:hypothetical protein
MVDSTGTRWAMSGHHSFQLEEIGGYGNKIEVSAPLRRLLQTPSKLNR